MSRVLLASNRLPITIRKVDGKKKITRSSGGLVAGLGPVHDESEGLWIGSLPGKEAVEATELRAKRLVAVDLGKEQAKRHYEGYSNQVLWPLFHYLLDHVRFQGIDFDAYAEVNEAFADCIAEHAKPGDLIWVHDYHLMLLPRMLRERIPDAHIAFFLHIPFPSSEVFRLLPRKEEILRGLLGADLIGVHTYDYARHLVSSLRRVAGVEFDEDWVSTQERCKVGVFPLGVDAEHFETIAASSGVERRMQRILKTAEGRKVVLGVDRMDYTKGLDLRFQAFRRLLETKPHWRRNAIFMQLAVPSRSTIGSYRKLKNEIERFVGEINGAFAHEGNIPVHYMYRSVPMEELAAMYRVADVCWVTPVRDGMNLVAKEYVACRPSNSGVLVLSEFAGAAAEMGEALMHNPWDIDGSARVLDEALRLPSDEITERMRRLRKRVQSNTVHHWVKRFLAEFRSAAERASAYRETDDPAHVDSPKLAPWVDDLLQDFGRAPKALVALDYDGTLVELKPRPEMAAPDDEILEQLRQLAALPLTEVVVISGRDKDTLMEWVGGLDVTLVAEHGLWYRARSGEGYENLLQETDVSWKPAVRQIFEDYAARCTGAIIEEKHASLAWHYREVEPGFGEWQSRELAQHLSEAFSNIPVEVLHGSKVIEVRPVGFNKGAAFNTLMHRLGPFDFVFAAGDDRTDEDMFHVLSKEHWTVKVGPGASQANHRVSGTPALRRLLTRLVGARGDLSVGAEQLHE